MAMMMWCDEKTSHCCRADNDSSLITSTVGRDDAAPRTAPRTAPLTASLTAPCTSPLASPVAAPLASPFTSPVAGMPVAPAPAPAPAPVPVPAVVVVIVVVVVVVISHAARLGSYLTNSTRYSRFAHSRLVDLRSTTSTRRGPLAVATAAAAAAPAPAPPTDALPPPPPPPPPRAPTASPELALLMLRHWSQR